MTQLLLTVVANADDTTYLYEHSDDTTYFLDLYEHSTSSSHHIYAGIFICFGHVSSFFESVTSGRVKTMTVESAPWKHRIVYRIS